ncbi:MAG TPA: helix-turn-helix transcriptional regulator [Vicinamibacterales bacterium]|nr:helix-turn-helix transcriptional regulator [Vicinamibacterales bacterium]
MTGSFGARLRAQRERRGISLDEVASRTKINVALFEAMERDDASRWPSGLFRRAFMRAYATEVGLDPEPIVREFLERFPDPLTAAHGPAKGESTGETSSTGAGGLRLMLAEETSRFPPVPRWLGRAPRLSAAGIDLTMVLSVAVAVFAIANRFWTPLTIATMCYYVGGVVILGSSPGGWLAARARKASRSDLRSTRSEPQTAAPLADGRDNVKQFPARRYRKAV